jgi:hypothetical protein
MTIRDYLRRRWWKANACIWGGILSAALLRHFAPDFPISRAISVVLLFAGIAAGLQLMRRTPCPSCGAALGFAAVFGSSALVKGDCPRCGTRFDADTSYASRW